MVSIYSWLIDFASKKSQSSLTTITTFSCLLNIESVNYLPHVLRFGC